MKTFIPYERKLRLCEEIVKLSIYIDEDTQVAARGIQAEAATYWVLAREYLDGYVDPGEEFDPMSAMHVADLLSDEGMIETLKNNTDVQMLLRMVEDAQNAFIRQYDKDHSILFHLGKRLIETHWIDQNADSIDKLCQAQDAATSYSNGTSRPVKIAGIAKKKTN